MPKTFNPICNPNDPEPDARHAYRMERKKAVIDEKIAAAQIDRGVLLVLTGNGKGKSSSAFGMALRALAHGLRCGIVQFIKSAEHSADLRFFQQLAPSFPLLACHTGGAGFTWQTQNRQRDREATEDAWQHAECLLADENCALVVLDELNIALKQGLLPRETVEQAIRQRPAMQHVVVTGRAAPDWLIEMADTVSRIDDVKHAFRAGVRAQKGIEW